MLLLLLFVIGAIILSNIYYIVLDQEPQAWDQALHMTYSYIYYKLISTFHFGQIIHVSNYYPPFFHLSSVPLYFMFGFSEDVAVYVNIIYYLILVFSVYNIAKYLWGREAGIVAAILVSFYPALIRLQREYLLDFALTSIVSLSIYFFMKSKNFNSIKYSILFGITLGLAQLLKWNAFIFILPIVAISLLPIMFCEYCGKLINGGYKVGMLKFCSKKHAKMYEVQCKGNRVLNALISFSLAFIIAAWWYIPNLSTVIRRLSYFASIGVKEGDPTVFSMEGWMYYITHMSNGMGFYFLLFIIGLVLLLYKRKIEKSTFLLISAIVIPYLILTALSNKDPRYIVPIFPFAALITSKALENVSKNKKVIVLLIIIGLIHLSAVTFGYPNIFISDKPKREDWKIHELLDTICMNSKGGEIVVVLPDHVYLNGQSLEFYRIIGGYNFRVYNGVYLPFEVVSKNIDKIGFIILIEPREHKGVYGEVEKKLYELFYSNKDKFKLIKTFDLPDGTKLYLYKNKNI